MEKLNPIKFKTFKEDSYYSYHLPINTQLSILEDALIDYNHKYDEETWRRFYDELGLCSQLGWDDDTYLYALIFRYLFKDNKTMMVSNSYIERIKKGYEKKASDLDTFETYWSNCIEYTYADEDASGLAREFGFMNVFEFAKEVNYYTYHQNKDNPYAKNWKYEAVYLNNHLLKFFYRTYSSDVTSWCFLSGKDLKNVQKKLIDSSKKPKVQEILDEVDTMITIQLGEDEGYQGYVLVHSKNDITDKIKKMERMIVDFGTRYEKFLPEIDNIIGNNSNKEIFLAVKKFLDDFDEEYKINF